MMSVCGDAVPKTFQSALEVDLCIPFPVFWLKVGQSKEDKSHRYLLGKVFIFIGKP